MYINRFLENKLMKYLDKKEILAVIGPRQCGKTTLLKHIFEKLDDALFLDFEDRQMLELFNEDIDSFIDLYIKGYKYVFIDEFQYAKEGGRNLKYIYDKEKTKLIISCSSSSELSIHSIKYLVGRIFVFNLYPFSFDEILSFKNPSLFAIYRKKHSDQIIKEVNKYFREYVTYGGYPRVIISENNEEKETVLRNIYNTYFLREIKQILNLKDDYKLSKLIHALALQIGNIINYNELSLLSGFNYQELLANLNILEKTYISFELRPFYSNKRTELVKSPKVFFFDNGFRNIVIKNFQKLNDRQDKGALYENAIADEFIKNDVGLKYWRTKSKAEVDFVVEEKGEIVPIEVKSNLREMNVPRSLYSFIEKYKPLKAYMLTESLSGKKKINDTSLLFLPHYFAAHGLETGF
ncbi:MAG: ATP-binding protein [Nanoarchaeota archaeon]|nr:ATP-binding protein [Nanoarchaeota archaeon]